MECRQKIFVLVHVMLLLAIPLSSQVDKGKPVLGLMLESDKSSAADGEAYNAATSAFFQAKRFNIVERRQLETVFSEKDLQEFLGGKPSRKLSDTLGLDLLGLVSYSASWIRAVDGLEQTHWILNVHLVEVSSARVIATISSERRNRIRPPASSREASAALFESVREAFPPLGYVINVSGNRITVDLGEEAGIKPGDVLEVVGEAQEIIHPVTGQVIPSEPEVLAEVRVLSVSRLSSVCKPKSTGARIQNASLVRLKQESSLWKVWVRKIPFVRGVMQPGTSQN